MSEANLAVADDVDALLDQVEDLILRMSESLDVLTKSLALSRETGNTEDLKDAITKALNVLDEDPDEKDPHE